MATIGTFEKSGNEFQGEIFTLSVQAPPGIALAFIPGAALTSPSRQQRRVR